MPVVEGGGIRSMVAASSQRAGIPSAFQRRRRVHVSTPTANCRAHRMQSCSFDDSTPTDPPKFSDCSPPLLAFRPQVPASWRTWWCRRARPTPAKKQQTSNSCMPKPPAIVSMARRGIAKRYRIAHARKPCVAQFSLKVHAARYGTHDWNYTGLPSPFPLLDQDCCVGFARASARRLVNRPRSRSAALHSGRAPSS